MIYSKFAWKKDSVLELSNAKRAYIYYRKTRLNLLSGFPETYPFEKFLETLESMTLQENFENPRVFHFHYEFGLITMGLGHTVNDEMPLVIEIEYATKKVSKKPKSKLTSIPLKSLERPSWTEYKGAFGHIQEELLKGNAYQVNLTYPYDFETEDVIDPRDICNYFFAKKNLAGFAHSTFLGDEMILSNSPECLFDFSKGTLKTMPIKGTRQRGKDWKQSWDEMQNDPKEEAELNMITDLLRNDLNRLEEPRAIVKKMRAPLLVPGLLHQYSLIEVQIKKSLSLLKVMSTLHPGGSITGAPKKRVMEIIQNVERYNRGIYCGSTLLCLGERKIACINIRTASLSIADRLWRYGAGGGVTLLSKPNTEFQEMESKVSSFLTLLNAPGYQSHNRAKTSV